jgi:predicted Zn-dependent peptidase
VREDIQETRFDNGLVVLTDRMPGVRSATLGFFYRTGARHEPADLNGITHFIEHCVFKGTTKRSAMEIAIEQDRLGGTLDAFTTHEETGFVVKVIDDQLDAAFDLLADMLSNPLFAEADLINEQHVIIEEMKMNEDSPEERLGDIFQQEFFAGHPLGVLIPGTPETVRTFGHERTGAYHKAHFVPGNLVLAAAGNVEHDRILVLARLLAENHPVGETPPPLLGKEGSFPVPVTQSFVVKQRHDLEQAHLIIATPFVAAPDDRRYAADLAANMLGGGTSSRLWQRIREERGLAYSVGASAVMYQDAGVFSVFAGTSPEQTREVVELSMAEMRSVLNDGFTADELELAKAQSRAAVLLSLEDSASRVSSLAQCELVHGRQISVEETLAGIDAVTLYDCSDLVREFFTTDNIAFTAIGDLREDTVTRDHLRL